MQTLNLFQLLIILGIVKTKRNLLFCVNKGSRQICYSGYSCEINNKNG